MIDPKSLTPEERRQVEEMVNQQPPSWGCHLTADGAWVYGGWLQAEEWKMAYEAAIARIEAQRALFSVEMPKLSREEPRCRLCKAAPGEHEGGCTIGNLEAQGLLRSSD